MPSPNTTATSAADAGPLVGVVIPVYNRAALIGRALESVFAQTYENYEIIVVDDASTDELADALAAFDDGRLRRLTHPINRGAAAARNTGIAAARGDFIAFLDSDDAWFPEKLARQIAAMRGQPADVAGHVCAYACVKAGYSDRVIAPDWTADGFARAQLFGCTCGPGSTLLCRRAVFDDVGPLDEELRRLEDWDWFLRLAAKGYRLLASDKVLARVEVGWGSSPAAMVTASERIRSKHEVAIAGQGSAARRIFASTLHLERAAAAFNARSYSRAVLAVLRAVASYPWRGRGFYARLIENAVAPLRRRLPGASPR